MREFNNVAELADCVGEEIGVSDWFSIDQDRINDFADANATFTEDDILKYKNKTPGYEGGDWVGALIDNGAYMHQHNLSISGGTDSVKYFTSFGYVDQESFFTSRDFDYKRYNVRSNLDLSLIHI